MASIKDRLDLRHISVAAAYAAIALEGHESVRVDLTPGDRTRYPLVIVAPGHAWTREGVAQRDEYVVSLLHGKGKAYPWAGGHLAPEYTTEKWSPGNSWTGEVISLFLNELSDRLGLEDR